MKQILVVLYEANAIFGLQFTLCALAVFPVWGWGVGYRSHTLHAADVCTKISLMPVYYVASLILSIYQHI
jgi:hypothetical protein